MVSKSLNSSLSSSLVGEFDESRVEPAFPR